MSECSRKGILVVEDSPILSMELEDLLRDAGYAVVGPAVDVETVLRLVADSVIDGAVLDINSSGQTVFPVARKLLELKIPFLFLSAYPAVVLRETEFEACLIVEKPFLSKQLLSHVQDLVQAPCQ